MAEIGSEGGVVAERSEGDFVAERGNEVGVVAERR